VTPSSPSDWTLDPLERARFLDGEGTPSERAAREAHLAADPAARARVERDAAFLDVVRRAREAREEVPAGLEARLRAALAADREAGSREPAPAAPALVRPRARTYAFAAAAAAAGLVAWLGLSGAPESHAQDEATLAADAARGARSGRLPGPAGATCEHAVASPYRFPLVANGELRIAGCRPTEDAEGVVSVVGGMEGLAPRGLVSVRAPTPPPPSGKAPDVGVLTLEDMVVFDVSLGGVRYTLAAPRESVERLGRCAACHSTSRDGQENPHRFVERQP
jgi:hypothetical protein